MKGFLECLKKEYIAVFGNGYVARDELIYLKLRDVHVDCFIVSGDYEHPSSLYGIPIFDISSYPYDREKTVVVIGRDRLNWIETKILLNSNGFNNVYGGITQMPIKEISHDDIKIAKRIYKASAFSEIKDEFGSNRDVVRICIYSVTSQQKFHNIIMDWKSQYIEHITAGAINCKEINTSYRDDIGDNISEKNRYYNELTAAYWISKNDVQNEWIGLCHYSRVFELSDDDIANIGSYGVDAYIPMPYKWEWDIESSFWLSMPNNKRWIKEALNKLDPECLKYVDEFFSDKFFVHCNMVICKREIFIDLYQWMFRILDYLETKLIAEKMLTDRAMGYLGEMLSNIYWLKQKENISLCLVPLIDLF